MKLKRTNLYEQIAGEIRDYIIKNQIQPGERLPTERELAEMLGVSRTSVREGIRLLETLQFLEVKPKRGITVKKLELSSLVRQLTQRILLEKNRFVELIEARRILEQELVKLAAVRATEEDLTRLELTIELMAKQLAQGKSIKQADLCFHQALFSAAKNSVLEGFQTALADFFSAALLKAGSPEKNAETLREHQLIYQAVKDRQPDAAASAMRQHLNYAGYFQEQTD